MDARKFSLRLKSWRSDNKMSLEELAKKIGTSKQTLSRWERGLAYPHLKRIPRIAEVMGVSEEYVAGYDMSSDAVSRRDMARSAIRRANTPGARTPVIVELTIMDGHLLNDADKQELARMGDHLAVMRAMGIPEEER